MTQKKQMTNDQTKQNNKCHKQTTMTNDQKTKITNDTKNKNDQ